LRWVQGAAYRAHVVEILAALNPDDYDGQRTDLIDAYSLLSWAEIYAGEVEKGIADTHKAISLSNQTDGHPALDTAYENGINALVQKAKYEQAESLLNEFTQTLSGAPAGTVREREFATVVDADKASIAEARKQYPQAVTYRIDAVKRLSALDPKAYDGVKADLVSAYGNLSFGQEEAGNFVQGVEAAKAGLNLDPSQAWIEENEGSGLLLNGHPEEAKTLYMKIKDIQWHNAPLSSAISDDLTLFCKLGYTRPETASIAHDLGITSPELFSCLAASAHAGTSK
jgi:tetratricopeptide (TPR) repeat protein